MHSSKEAQAFVVRTQEEKINLAWPTHLVGSWLLLRSKLGLFFRRSLSMHTKTGRILGTLTDIKQGFR
jgi:hypothetical protein